jgi:hypothetical protein
MRQFDGLYFETGYCYSNLNPFCLLGPGLVHCTVGNCTVGTALHCWQLHCWHCTALLATSIALRYDVAFIWSIKPFISQLQCALPLPENSSFSLLQDQAQVPHHTAAATGC